MSGNRTHRDTIGPCYAEIAVNECVATALPVLAIIGVSLTLTIWGVSKNASSAEEKQKALASLFGGWPPSKGNVLMLVVFFGGLVLLSGWLCISRTGHR